MANQLLTYSIRLSEDYKYDYFFNEKRYKGTLPRGSYRIPEEASDYMARMAIRYGGAVKVATKRRAAEHKSKD